MKYILLVLALIAAPLFGGTVTDNANLFGPDQGRVASSLPSDVYVETFVASPDANLKRYADSEVATLTNRGFLIVVTLQPRSWRTSMNPIGLAGSENVRMIGDKMVRAFKRGRHADGVIEAARELNMASHPSTPIHYATVVSSGSTYRVVEQRTDYTWVWWLLGGIVALIVIILIIAISVSNAKLRAREEARKDAELEWSRRLRDGRDNATVEARTAAQTMYDQYTPAQRQQVMTQYVNHPGYSSSLLSDPLMFYMFMTMVNDHSYGNHGMYGNAGYNQPSYAQPSSSYDSAPAPRNDDPPATPWSESSPSSSSSRSDDSGSGGSWGSDSSSSSSDSGSSSSDSGGGSFDSGSSSDSSGGGGSW